MPEPRLIWMNGAFVPFAEAKVHVLAPVVKYGALVFEGLCGYWNADEGQNYLFRLREHLVRLQHSMRILRFAQDYQLDQLSEMVVATVAENDLRQDVHIRVSAWIDGFGTMESIGPVGLMCAAMPRGERSLAGRAASGTVSNWRRIDDRSMPPRVKSAANYNNGRLAQMQAKADGYDEALLLATDGKVAEGTGACIFIVRDGIVATPPITSGILESVTRATLIEIARDLGYEVQERVIDRTELYLAEEVFLCGSAYEVTPITSVDKLAIGSGKAGPVTEALWTRYEAIVRGSTPDHAEWRLACFASAPRVALARSA